ncbi:MAG: 6-hydroxymethylpterin diphosphokinase MptE-like protein, partial [Ginsengibacter sp.]
EQTGFDPTYIVVHDINIQLLQFRDDLNKLKSPKFFNWNARKHFTKSDNLVFLRSDYTPKFSTDLTKTSWGGHSVTNVCIQLAFYMGFSEVYLVGKDHNYEQKGIPGKLLKATGEEKNHFAKGYYKKGMEWRIPDYKGEELAYTMAREAFEKHGRKIYDATVDGHLKVFQKVDYYSLFSVVNK